MTLWYFYDATGKQGPFRSSELKILAGTGQIAPDTLVETDTGKKAKASAVKGLFPSSAPQAEVPVSHPAPPEPISTNETDLTSSDSLFTLQQPQPAAPQPVTPLPSQPPEWSFYENGIKIGPLPIEILLKMSGNTIFPDTLLEDSAGNRFFAKELPSLFHFNTESHTFHNRNSDPAVTSQKMSVNINNQVDIGPTEGEKNRITAAILALFFGPLGVHKFYLGRTGEGILFLILTITFIGCIVTGPLSLIEAINLFTMSDRMFHQKFG